MALSRVLSAILSLLSFAVLAVLAQSPFAPEQIHASYLGGRNISFTWVTQNATSQQILRYGVQPGEYTSQVAVSSQIFEDLGPQHRRFWVHSAVVTDFEYGKTYYYAVGADASGWSSDLVFNMVPPPGSPLRLAVFGDLGYNNSVCLPQLLNRTLEDSYDAIIHVGDIAYDLDTNNAQVGDEWMRAVQPMASRVPYMVCPGNHEADHYGSFNNYIYRFRMPQYESSSNLWFSFQLGPVYFVAVSTEVYFFPAQMLAIPAQWQWLQAELARAQAQRDAYPWLIVYAHRPLYCSDRDSSTYTDCTADTEIVREGLLGKWGLESLLYEYGVDLYLCGHEHSYERLWPVYQSRVYNGSLEAPYTDPGAPIHIISGAAGNQEEFDVFGPPNSWSAFRSVTYGFGELTIFNSTVALWRQVLANGTVLDEITIVKHSHGPYTTISVA